VVFVHACLFLCCTTGPFPSFLSDLLIFSFLLQIVLGAIASKSHMALARSALLHLETAYNLFSKVSDHARAGKIIVRSSLLHRCHSVTLNSPFPFPLPLAYSPKVKGQSSARQIRQWPDPSV